MASAIILARSCQAISKSIKTKSTADSKEQLVVTHIINCFIVSIFFVISMIFILRIDYVNSFKDMSLPENVSLNFELIYEYDLVYDIYFAS